MHNSHHPLRDGLAAAPFPLSDAVSRPPQAARGSPRPSPRARRPLPRSAGEVRRDRGPRAVVARLGERLGPRLAGGAGGWVSVVSALSVAVTVVPSEPVTCPTLCTAVWPTWVCTLHV